MKIKNKDHQKESSLAMISNTAKQIHIPVLLKEVLEVLDPKEGESYVDMTAGFGGHASAVIGRTLQIKDTVLIDRDKMSIASLAKKFGSEPLIIHSDYLSASQELANQGRKFDLLLADLGVSSLHLDSEQRGFSFKKDGPVDMRMDLSQNLDAKQILNQWTEAEITKIISNYGEEPKARKISKKIVESRPVNTTKQLENIVLAVYEGRWRKTNPSTKTFQALRMAVNDELGQLERALPLWLQLLKPNGRIAIISFHSLEDRIIKEFFKDKSQSKFDAELSLVNKKPIVPSQKEIEINPRSRSAKLRAAVKK